MTILKHININININNYVSLTLITILFIIIYIVYSKYLLLGGFSVGDDIPLTVKAINGQEVLSFKHYERPVSYIFYNFFHNFFKDNVSLFIILSLFSWLILVSIIFLTLKNFINKASLYIFLLLSPFPFFASTIITGVHLFCGYTFALIFWSLSLYFIIEYSKKLSFGYYCLSSFFLLVAFFTSVIFLPLLVLNIFLPILITSKKNNYLNLNDIFWAFLNFFLPVFIISFLFISYKILGKNFFNRDIIYGIAPISLKSLLQSLYFFVTILIELPILLISSLKFILNITSGIILIFVGFFYFLLNKFFYIVNSKNIKIISPTNENFFLLILFLSLIASTIIFFISNYPAQSFGYYNRMMVSAFISLTIIIALLISKLLDSKLIFLPVLLSFLWINSMNIQVQNNIDGWKLKEFIIQDIINKLIDFNITNKTFLVANVPYFLKNNYNNEELFMTKWSFSNHISLKGGPSITAWPTTYRSINDLSFFPGHNINNNIHKIKDDAELIYYEFLARNQSKITKIQNKEILVNQLNLSLKNNVNYRDIILTEKLRLFSKSLVY